MNANIEKKQFFCKMKYDIEVIQGHKRWPFYLKIYFLFYLCYWDLRSYRTTLMLWRGCVAFLLTDLMTTLTYVLMDNFWPCFLRCPYRVYGCFSFHMSVWALRMFFTLLIFFGLKNYWILNIAFWRVKYSLQLLAL